MVEVCSTTLPQQVLPKVLEHPNYAAYLQDRLDRYQRFSNIAYECLKDVKGVLVNQPNGAFYMSVCFEDGALNRQQSLAIANNEIRNLIETLVAEPGTSCDKRFVYYLLGTTGVCVVPLTSFATELKGFRITLLERSEDEFKKIFETVAESIAAYLASG